MNFQQSQVTKKYGIAHKNIYMQKTHKNEITEQ